MSKRNSVTIWLTDDEHARLKVARNEGNTIVDIFRAGLDHFKPGKDSRILVEVPQIKMSTKSVSKKASEVVDGMTYACGCQLVPGHKLCPTHGRA